jgi:hypothetical protein
MLLVACRSSDRAPNATTRPHPHPRSHATRRSSLSPKLRSRDLANFRASGLYTVFACDPDAGRKVARSVRADRDLADAAKDVLSR